MNKLLFQLILMIVILSSCGLHKYSDQSLMVSKNNRYLVTPDGKPFLWIGDTAWELFHRLDREEAVKYLENRVHKGISVIQAVILAEQDGLRIPNAYGELPLENMDPKLPNEAYFEHVDFIVNKAAELGFFIGMLPTWGDKIFSLHPGAGPVIFDCENAKVFGEYLGKRYKDQPIIWILGGDRNVANPDVLEIWRAMAEGIRKGDGGRHLITYHPRGATSSSWYLHNETWLDFNMYQSGHTQHYSEVYRFAEHDALLHPKKPYLDGEPPYEDIGVSFWNYWDIQKANSPEDTISPIDHLGVLRDPSVYAEGLFDDSDVRVHGYWNFLSGACGYTYGNNAIWQMWERGIPYAIPCIMDWQEALDRPGVNDLRHLRRIFEARSFHKLLPDQSIIFGPVPGGKAHIRTAIAFDKTFMLAYLSIGQSVRINMEKMDHEIRASWYDTREGLFQEIGLFPNKGIQEFKPPSSGEGNDWLLVLDDSKASLEPL